MAFVIIKTYLILKLIVLNNIQNKSIDGLFMFFFLCLPIKVKFKYLDYFNIWIIVDIIYMLNAIYCVYNYNLIEDIFTQSWLYKEHEESIYINNNWN